MGVHGDELVRRPQQRGARPGRLAGAGPVRGDLHRGGAGGLQRRRELAVQGAAAQPRHVGVERLAGQGVTERAAAVAVLAGPAALDQLGHAVGAGHVGHEHQVERGAGDGGRVGRGAPLVGQLHRREQHGVADGLGDGDLALPADLQALGAGDERPGGAERPGQLLGEERDALGAVVERPRERRGRRVAQDRRREVGGLVGAEGAHGQLRQAPPAAQLVPQPAHRVVARQPVGAVRPQHEGRHVGERLRDARHQFQGGVVAPVQVVEHQQQGAVGRGGGQDSADRLRQRGRVGLGRRRAELGEHHRQVVPEAAGAVDHVGIGAQVGPEGLGERRVRRAAGGVRPAPQHGQARPRRKVVGEAGLADPGLAGQEHHAPGAGPRALQGLLEPPLLGVAADQGGTGAHDGETNALGPPTAAGATVGGRGRQAVAATGSGRRMTVSRTGMISSHGRPEASA